MIYLSAKEIIGQPAAMVFKTCLICKQRCTMYFREIFRLEQLRTGINAPDGFHSPDDACHLVDEHTGKTTVISAMRIP